LRPSAPAPEGSLGPRIVRRQAVPGRESAPAARAQGRLCRARRTGGEPPRPAPGGAHRRSGRGDDDQRVVLLPRQDPVRIFPRRDHAGAVGGARGAAAYPHLVRRRLDRPGTLFARDLPQGDEPRHRRLAHRHYRHRPLRSEVVEAMTTNESFFFRDKTPFEYFRDVIMPALLVARAAQRRIRIWCAAASTGQEPYSLAICLKEMSHAIAGWRIDIIATDLSDLKWSRR